MAHLEMGQAHHSANKHQKATLSEWHF